MVTWIQGVMQGHPEIAFFLVLGLGYLLGKLALGSFKLGAVTGTLLAGVLVGQFGVTLPDAVKQCFFLLFLFAIGFRTGPQFFRGLKSDGLQHAAVAAVVAVTGLLVAWIVARLFGYDAGTAAGLVAGSLTESATIGTAMDAISKLELSEAERLALNNGIPVAFAVTYLVGVIGATSARASAARASARPRSGLRAGDRDRPVRAARSRYGDGGAGAAAGSRRSRGRHRRLRRHQSAHRAHPARGAGRRVRPYGVDPPRDHRCGRQSAGADELELHHRRRSGADAHPDLPQRLRGRRGAVKPRSSRGAGQQLAGAAPGSGFETVGEYLRPPSLHACPRSPALCRAWGLRRSGTENRVKRPI